MKEFIEGMHLKSYDKQVESLKYLLYMRNREESKAFQGGLLASAVSLPFFKRINNFKFPLILNSAFYFHSTLFVFLITYELIHINFTNRGLVSKLDTLILLKGQEELEK